MKSQEEPRKADSEEPSSIDWSTQGFSVLETEFKRELKPSDTVQYALVLRYEKIMNFVESDRIWPPTEAKARIIPAFKEVLTRLPEEDFDVVDEQLQVIVEDENIWALNVPTSLSNASPKACMVVFFHWCWKLNRDALIGLVAHELAHTFVSGGDYHADEAAADARTRHWGFQKELDCLASEQRRIIAPYRSGRST